MAPEGKPFVIALEEHYYDSELAATFDGPEGRAPEIRRRLDDLGELRLKEMGSRYAFIALYVFFEHHLSRGDYRRAVSGADKAAGRWHAGSPSARILYDPATVRQGDVK